MSQPLRQLLDGSDTLFTAEPAGSAYSERILMFTNATRFLQEIDLVSSDPAHLRIMPARCELGTGESTFVFALLSARVLQFFGNAQRLSRRPAVTT
jgi:hypothetical protein